MPPNPPLGLGILKLVTATTAEEKPLAESLLHRAQMGIDDRDSMEQVIELVEGLLIRRHPRLTREVVRAMFNLTDIRKTRVWQEAVEEGREEGVSAEQARIVRRCAANGMSAREIADLTGIPIAKVRRLARRQAGAGDT